MTTRAPQWSDEAVAESFRSEIEARFVAHNAAWREREAADLEVFLSTHPERRGQPGFEVRDSGEMLLYRQCEIRIDRNEVTVILPPDHDVTADLIHMFDNTTASWSRPSVSARTISGGPRLTIEITLVATWDDAMEAAWRRDGNDRTRVVVELFADEVRTLADLDIPSTLRDRLKLALEP